jgi:hypothetical protein
MGIVFVLFGALKFFPSFSPAEDLGINTVQMLTLGFFTPKMAIISLALFEVLIGLGLIFQKFYKITIIAALIHMACTFTPFFLYPDLTFASEVFTPSLLGQYILKNIVLIMALLVLYPNNKSHTTFVNS